MEIIFLIAWALVKILIEFPFAFSESLSKCYGN